jgi:hypothetical protein
VSNTGTLVGYEVRKYVFEKFGCHCVYCGIIDLPFNLGYVIAKPPGGSNRVSTLVPAGVPRNNAKEEATSIEEFLAHDPKRLAAIKAQLKAPLKDAAFMSGDVAAKGRFSIPTRNGVVKDVGRILQRRALPLHGRALNPGLNARYVAPFDRH